MFPTLPPSTQDELEQLAQRYGRPLVHDAVLDTPGMFDPLNRTDRFGEVCMVVRRRNGNLLAIKKTFYPPGAYRLPTGGINHGEHILDALRRETYEETGLEVNVTRFLAAVAYHVGSSEANPLFYTFAFLLDEISGLLQVVDENERIEAFREVKPADLLLMADYLNGIGTQHSSEINGDWRDWGRFRAVIHRLVWEALKAA
ncbi:MAG TPA: NUDIX hydrolase [Ktedonobacteraceae bacterium]|nr:NUDIX hydrolase [Ktedonobacteraceae bacterium]